jgi:methanol metabolism-related c-type cytochrome
MLVRNLAVAAIAAAASLPLGNSIAFAQEGPGSPEAVTEEDGKHFDAEGNPTFKVEADGTVDWYIFSGYRRYHADCHVCHGPDGAGSSYAPALADSLKRMTYPEFLAVVAQGRQNTAAGKESVMPSFGTNLNVMCYIDDLYIYLRARAQGDLPRGRPAKRQEKPASFAEAESACMGS